jgi:hypothetical protein
MPAQPGQLLRRRLLGTEAVYRVVADEGELVEVEVVSAPGLEPGHRLRFTAAAVEEMEPAEPRPARARPSGAD